MAQKPLGPLDDIGLVAEGAEEHVLVLQQFGVLEQREHLAEEGDGLLVQLLGVPDVGGDDLVEGQVLVAGGQLGAEELGLDGQLAPHGVLGGHDILVDVVDVEPRGGRLCGRHGGGRGVLALGDVVDAAKGSCGMARKGWRVAEKKRIVSSGGVRVVGPT